MNRVVTTRPNLRIRHLATAGIIALLSCVLPAGAAAAAADAVTPDRWSPPEVSQDARFPTNNVRWSDGVETTSVIPASQLPLRMVVEEEVARVLGTDTVARGVAGWNGIAGSRFSAQLTGTVRDGLRAPRADGVNRIFLDDSCTGNAVGWAYVTKVTGDMRYGIRGGYVADGDIGLCRRLLDRPGSAVSTIRHEVGHLMGLGHAEAPCQVMAATNDDCDSMSSAEHDAARYMYARMPRLAGPTRFETSSRSVYATRSASGSAGTVVVVDGRGPTELPVTAAALAGALDAPMLLADGDCLAAPTGPELQRVATARAEVLLVGPGVAGCADALRSRGYTPVTLATPAALAERFPAGMDTVLVVRGAMRDGNLPDGLTAAAVAGRLGAPILLTDGEGLASWSAAFLQQRPTIERAIVVGGTGAIPASVTRELAGLGISSDRRGGQDRIDTALALATTPGAFPDRGEVLVVSSQTWPDAVAGSAIGAANGWPVLLTPRGALDPRVGDFVSRYATGGFVMGGRAAISDHVAVAVNAHLR